VARSDAPLREEQLARVSGAALSLCFVAEMAVTMGKAALNPSLEMTITGRRSPICSLPMPGSRFVQKVSQRRTGPV